MKRLVQIDPTTHTQSTICTFELVDDKVVAAPASALEQRSYLQKLLFGSKRLTPADGVDYYDALSSVRGSYYFVEEVPATEATE